MKIKTHGVIKLTPPKVDKNGNPIKDEKGNYVYEDRPPEKIVTLGD